MFIGCRSVHYHRFLTLYNLKPPPIEFYKLIPPRWHHHDITPAMCWLLSDDTCHSEKGHLGAQNHHICMPHLHLLLASVEVTVLCFLGQSWVATYLLLEEREKGPLRHALLPFPLLIHLWPNWSFSLYLCQNPLDQIPFVVFPLYFYSKLS